MSSAGLFVVGVLAVGGTEAVGDADTAGAANGLYMLSVRCVVESQAEEKDNVVRCCCKCH